MTRNYFTKGSHQSEVIRLQGTPQSVLDLIDEEQWSYGYSSVIISKKTKKVTRWSNVGNSLHVKMTPGKNVTSNNYFTKGSHQDDVIRLQGTPQAILDLIDEEQWSYGYSSVTISKTTKKVIRWSNTSNNLHVRMISSKNITKNNYFTQGSHQDDVIRLQGAPQSILDLIDEEQWSYGYSSVTISKKTKKVTRWSNVGDKLHVRMIPGKNVTKKSYFSKGSHQDDVIRLHGTPQTILDLIDEEQWSYQYSSVTISKSTRKVLRWSNSSNNLKVR